MWDTSVPMIGLIMRSAHLENLPRHMLPEQYGWRFYCPGDESAWADIEVSAGEFSDKGAALIGFRRYYPVDAGLDGRMLFLTDGGIPFATATAWYGEGAYGPGEGRLHWVAIDAAHQGQRLSYPLVSLTMARLFALGHKSAYLTTQTNSWPAIKVYRHFGFRPLADSPEQLEGWRIVSEKTGIDFIREI